MNTKLAEEILKKALIGNSFAYFKQGDWIALQLLDYWLVAQDIESPEEFNLNCLLEKADPPILNGVDPENVAKSAILHRNSRRKITNITLHNDSSLSLYFDHNREIILITSTPIVDWHWCLNKSGEDPYHDYLVACFQPGTIDVCGQSES